MKNGGQILWADSKECYSYLRNIQDLLSDGETPYDRRFGEPFFEGAREAAWKFARNIRKIKEEKDKTAFFSPSENRCLLASNLKPEEREFVVDSGASMHVISTKGLE